MSITTDTGRDPMMNHLYEQLTALKLTGFRDALKKQLAQPGTYQELGFEERLSLLTAEELTCRENRKAERLIKHARFRLNAELSKLDYRNNRGLDRALIRSLSQGNWLTLKQNILLTGATGSPVVSQILVQFCFWMTGGWNLSHQNSVATCWK
ncbi:hypothetical protein EIMP300_01400 [Escherichia coli]|uniref:IstB-like ATP-binding domain-containing protein n=1 Tax=Escherichia coli TaxID=562 RepID=A0A8S0FHZ5_ECOLX|nr:hypothetical protein EIMP300_01400 [Escherichia coli]